MSLDIDIRQSKLLTLLKYDMRGKANLQDFVLEVLERGWYRYDFYMYPVRLKNTVLNPMSYELKCDLLDLEKKGYIEINGDKIKLLKYE